MSDLEDDPQFEPLDDVDLDLIPEINYLDLDSATSLQEIEKRIEADSLEASDLYTELIKSTRSIYRSLGELPHAGGLEVPFHLLERLITVLKSGNQELLALADRSVPDVYLNAHVLNVTIFSVFLGISLGLSDEELRTLAVSCFLHDLGMIHYLPIVMKPTRLTDAEIDMLKSHPEDSQKLLEVFVNLHGKTRDTVDRVIGQTHERSEGSGYPAKLESSDIHIFAKIIGVCDVYESLSHPRPWRARHIPHKALKLMIENQEKKFDPGMVRGFVQSLTLYPTGSFVKINTEEYARVIASDPKVPTRPKVKVLIDRNGNPLKEPEIINIATQTATYILDAVDETQIRSSHEQLILQLKAQRWWLRGL